MSVVIIVTIGVALWLVVPLPVAVVVGRAFRAGAAETPTAGIEIVRDYDAVGM